MGTINYRTSDYITMGVVPISAYDVEHDGWLMSGLEELYDVVDDMVISEYIEACYDSSYENTQFTLNSYKFFYFDIWVEIGYYEGFSVRIKYNYDGDKFANFAEKQEARAEIEEVKKCLEELADVGLVACYPSWGTKYEDYSGTLDKINEAVAEMAEDVRMTDVHRFEWEV